MHAKVLRDCRFNSIVSAISTPGMHFFLEYRILNYDICKNTHWEEAKANCTRKLIIWTIHQIFGTEIKECKIDRAFGTHEINAWTNEVENPERWNNSWTLYLDERIWKLFLMKEDVGLRTWNGFVWLRTGPVAGSSERCSKQNSMKCDEFFVQLRDQYLLLKMGSAPYS